jgi:hypothetical protein
MENMDNVDKTGEKEEPILTEFENKTPPNKKPENAGLQIILGVFFIGYGIFRVSSTMRGDGTWNTFFGWAMIVLGSIRIISVAVKK